MLIAAIVVGFGYIVGSAGVVLGIRWILDRKQREIERRIRDYMALWLEAPEEGKPSKLYELTNELGAIIGRAAAANLMAQIHAGESHVARVANSATGELMARENPILGALKSTGRGRGAAVAKLAEILGPMLLGKGFGPPAGGDGQSTSTASVRDRLQRGG